jgi:hypothetical protein
LALALAPLKQLAHRGKAIVVTRHARKAGGDVGEDGRGSSAFTGGVDIVLSLKRPPGNQNAALRTLEGLSRFDETPAQLVIEKVSVFRPYIGIEVWADSYRVIGNVEAAATDSAQLALRQHLGFTAMEAKSEEDLITATGCARSAVQRALKLFPDLQRIETGKTGNPFRYFREGKDSAQTPIS